MSTSVLAKVPNIRTAADAAARQANERKKLLFKNFVPFTHWIIDINNAQKDVIKNFAFVMPIYNLMD